MGTYIDTPWDTPCSPLTPQSSKGALTRVRVASEYFDVSEALKTMANMMPKWCPY